MFVDSASTLSTRLATFGHGRFDYGLFYLVTNLTSDSLREFKDSGELKKSLESAMTGIRVAHAQDVGDVGLFTLDSIARAAAELSPLRHCIERVSQGYARLILELDGDGTLRVQPALLDGFRCVALGSDTTVLAKVSVPAATSPDDVAALQSILNSRNATEADLQRFFETRPSLLSLGEYAAVYPQVILLRDDGSLLRPDFVLEPACGPLCSILDIKLPGERLLVRRKNRPRLTAKIHEHAAQLREYGRYFDSYSQRRWFRDKYGIDAFRPRLVMIVGRDYGAEEHQLLDELRPTLEPVELWTYDEILAQHRD